MVIRAPTRQPRNNSRRGDAYVNPPGIQFRARDGSLKALFCEERMNHLRNLLHRGPGRKLDAAMLGWSVKANAAVSSSGSVTA